MSVYLRALLRRWVPAIRLAHELAERARMSTDPGVALLAQVDDAARVIDAEYSADISDVRAAIRVEAVGMGWTADDARALADRVSVRLGA